MIRVPCVAAIVQNSRGQVLLNLRDDKPDLAFANCWTLPGGSVEPGEIPEQAAHRELSEETGLELPLTFWKMYERPRFGHSDCMIEQYVFTGWVDIEALSMTLGEGQALGFFDEESIGSLPIGFGFGKLLNDFFCDMR